MNVVLLSDFSIASLHMQDYAAMIFQNQDVHYTILHIKAPCKGKSCSGKCGALYHQKLSVEQKKLESKTSLNTVVKTKFIEGAYIESIRNFIKEERINLIMLGNSFKADLTKHLFFDKKTLEIITKVRCSVILVPERVQLKLPKTALLPTDYSITLSQSIFNSLGPMKFINQVELSLSSKSNELSNSVNKDTSKDFIYNLVNSLNFKSVNKNLSEEHYKCINDFDFVVVMAKNLSIFKDLFSFSSGSSSKCYPEAPILFLHDFK